MFVRRDLQNILQLLCSESKERIKCYKLGAQDYLTKPFNPEELEELVKKNLFPIHFSIEW
jgi:DNA-binding response OmpR family regulator